LITREQFNTPTISIYFNDIKEIVKAKNGNFVIKGTDPTDLIIVPAQIENYSEFETTLIQIKPIVIKSSNSFLQKYSKVITVLSLILIICVYTLSNKIIVTLSGITLVAIMLWSFYEVSRSKNIDAKTKRGMRWGVIVLASIIAVVIMKLAGVTKT
jgi:hypothetical protein